MIEKTTRVDLNLLRTFVAVYETRSLTIAAERLFVSQPAVSQAVGRLRRELDDPLFQRVGRRMQPSPLADTLYPQFRDSLLRIDRAVDAIHGFDPSTSERHFSIALSELGETGYFPAILRDIHAAAPRTTVEVVPLSTTQLSTWLSTGEIDLAITSSPVAETFMGSTLKRQRYLALMANGHSLARKELTLERYAAAEHVVVAGDSGAPNLREALRTLGVSVKARATVQHFAALPPLLTTSDLIATVPNNLARGWASTWPLATRPLPFAVSHVEVRLYKRMTSRNTAALEWLYGVVERAVRSTPAELFAAAHQFTST